MVGRRVKWLRKLREISQDELGRLVGLGQTAISRIEMGLRDLSFDTISGAGPNGAIVHYRVSPETNRTLEPGSLYLVGAVRRRWFPDVDIIKQRTPWPQQP